MNWFQKIMQGRYGTDQLNIALMVFYLILWILAEVTHFSVLLILSLFLLVAVFYRIFSKNISRRYQENMWFMQRWNKVKSFWNGFTARIRGMKTHRYYRCPKCHNTLRVPKGKGKIQITCPVCKTEFIKKT